LLRNFAHAKALGRKDIFVEICPQIAVAQQSFAAFFHSPLLFVDIYFRCSAACVFIDFLL